jgi:hypothetical protein
VQLLQFVVLPSRLGYVMVSEDLSVIGCEKSTAKNINVCLWSGPCKAHQAVVELVSSRLAAAGKRRVMQFQAVL